MAKAPSATSASTWWLDPPPVDGWFQRCLDQFDIRLSRKLGKALKPHQNAAAAHKLAQFRSGAASAAKAGVRRQGFLGGTERTKEQ